MSLRNPLFLLGLLSLTACDPVTMGLVTAGGGVAVNHQMSSTITRTFSSECADVHGALLAALAKMSITVTHSERHKDVEVISGTAGHRDISMRVEPVTRTSTLLEVAVHQDLLTMDGATAREIVSQTEHALDLIHLASHDSAGMAGSIAQTAGAGAEDGLPGRTTYYGRDPEPAPAAAPKAATKDRNSGSSRKRPQGSAPAAAAVQNPSNSRTLASALQP